MSSDASLLEALRAAYAKIAEVHAVAALHPGDPFVMASLSGIQAHAKALEDRWLSECRTRHIEVCRYRLISRAAGYTASAFARSILEFQEMFTQIYDSIKNGPKKRARVGGEIVAESTFGFAYSFPGSLGVVLTVQDEVNLLGGNFEEAVKAFQDIITIDNEHEVRDMARTLGDAAVKKIFDWSKSNYSDGFSVDVVWSHLNGQQRGGLIDRQSLGKLMGLIDRTSDVETNTVRTNGVLVAIDVKKRRFRFVVPEGEDFVGSLANDFDLSKQWAVNRPYEAEIFYEGVTRYATQRTDVTYTLRRLVDHEADE